MFVPIHDDNPMDHLSAPWMTRALIVLNVAIYFAFQEEMLVGEQAARAAAFGFGMIPAAVTNAAELPPFLRQVPDELTVVTYMFLHGGMLHLGSNMLFLWVFGDNVEDALGHVKFLVFYLLCGIAGGLAHTLAMPNSEIPLVGASGAISGCVAAYLMLHPKVKLWVLFLMRIPLRLTARWVLGIWVLFQVINVLAETEDGTAWWAHVGGLVAGAILVVVMRRPGVPLFDRGLEPGRMAPKT